MWNYIYRRRRGLRTKLAKTRPGQPVDLKKRPRPVVISATKADTPA